MKIRSVIFYLCAGISSSVILDSAFALKPFEESLAQRNNSSSQQQLVTYTNGGQNEQRTSGNVDGNTVNEDNDDRRLNNYGPLPHRSVHPNHVGRNGSNSWGKRAKFRRDRDLRDSYDYRDERDRRDARDYRNDRYYREDYRDSHARRNDRDHRDDRYHREDSRDSYGHRNERDRRDARDYRDDRYCREDSRDSHGHRNERDRRDDRYCRKDSRDSYAHRNDRDRRESRNYNDYGRYRLYDYNKDSCAKRNDSKIDSPTVEANIKVEETKDTAITKSVPNVNLQQANNVATNESAPKDNLQKANDIAITENTSKAKSQKDIFIPNSVSKVNPQSAGGVAIPNSVSTMKNSSITTSSIQSKSLKKISLKEEDDKSSSAKKPAKVHVESEKKVEKKVNKFSRKGIFNTKDVTSEECRSVDTLTKLCIYSPEYLEIWKSEYDKIGINKRKSITVKIKYRINYNKLLVIREDFKKKSFKDVVSDNVILDSAFYNVKGAKPFMNLEFNNDNASKTAELKYSDIEIKEIGDGFLDKTSPGYQSLFGDNVRAVVLPESVEVIRKNAFGGKRWQHGNITIIMPSTIQNIARGVFKDKHALVPAIIWRENRRPTREEINRFKDIISNGSKVTTKTRHVLFKFVNDRYQELWEVDSNGELQDPK